MSSPATTQTKEHLEEAEKFAHHIMEKYSLTEVNDILLTIRGRIKLTREAEMEKLCKRADELRDSLEVASKI